MSVAPWRQFLGTKPLVRWTVGPVSALGFATLRESVGRFRDHYGDRFDAVICHNGLDADQARFVARLGPATYAQTGRELESWVPHPPVGVAWKLYPPRLRPGAHEIVADNDVILDRPLAEIEEFLAHRDRPLVASTRAGGPVYGRHARRFPDTPDAAVNSGLYGLPPWFDFAAALPRSWVADGWHDYFDEQALVAHALLQFCGAPVRVPRDRIAYPGDEGGARPLLHLTGANHGFPGSWQFWRAYLAARGRPE